MADFVGKRFGKLVVVTYSRHKKNRAYWWCKCDCGVTKEVSSGNLQHARSCGCGRLEAIRTHGMSKSGVYSTWKAMLKRCLQPTHRSYRNYGGRGITIWPEWQDNFESFFRDMGPRPSKDHFIDRIDVDGNYVPGNVRWITRHDSNRNKRETVLIEFKGSTKPLVEWCEIFNIPYDTVFQRIRNSGWSTDDALTVPIGGYQKQDAITFNGETKTL